MTNKNIDAFLALVRAGLWGKEAQLSLFGDVDWLGIYQLTQEQALQGLVLAGIEHSYVKPPKELLLQWIGEVQQIEQRNVVMNQFIGELIEGLRRADVYAILVKGQGIALCYDRLLWRASGDVDLLLDKENFEKAKQYHHQLQAE